MKVDYEANFKGYITVPRAVLLLIPRHNLSFSELGTYLCFVMQADFDYRHKYQGVILRDDVEIGKKLNLSSSTVYRHRTKLIAMGLLVKKDGNTMIPNFEIFTHGISGAMANLNSKNLTDIFICKDKLSNTESQTAEMQKNQVQNDPQSFNDSSNDDLNSSSVSNIGGDKESLDDY